MASGYDALVVVSFGGPEGMDDVLPFLRNVVRGRGVPDERLREVAAHYRHFGGRSPINDQCRALVAAVQQELRRCGSRMPVYWGNRNWHPLLADTLRQMARDGVKRALAFVTSAFGSYSGCRQYLEDIARARAEVGPDAPAVDKLRAFYNHPGYVEPLVESVRAAFEEVPAARRGVTRLVFTAHSLPRAMAKGSPYEAQIRECAGLVAGALGRDFSLAWQSRSGPPGQPWLEPDVVDHLRGLAADGVSDVVVSPIGFVSDHMEVVYDLDLDAKSRALELGIRLVRAATVGTHPRFVRLVRELVEERLSDAPLRACLGGQGPAPDVCAPGCCLPPAAARGA
ncbi:MAG TPA: ferrochelatase [Vicinamibacteria bacterium]|nr:ferrochelatase [Vicinamibacteria bacterium]